MSSKGPPIVIKEIGSDSSLRWAVARQGKAFDGKWERNVLWIDDWFEKEDQARAYAHRQEHPDDV